VDGDVVSAKHCQALVAAASAKGKVVSTQIFAPQSGHTWSSSNWDMVRVPRNAGGGKDPNDIAISMEAVRHASTGHADAIALAVQDVDFAYLAAQLHSWGYPVMLLLPESSKVGLGLAFEAVGAEVLRYAPGGLLSGSRPKFKAVLTKNGESSIAEYQMDIDMDSVVDDGAAKDTLHALGYIEGHADPIIPAIAKFHYLNLSSPLTIWPDICARSEALLALSARSLEEWQRYSGGLAFVFPKASSTKTASVNARYGTSECRSVVLAGGPFILRDSDSLVGDFLTRLGYLDSDLSRDMAESVDVFCNVGQNRSSLSSLGVDFDAACSLSVKVSSLRDALLSAKGRGVWKVAPSDVTLRQTLVANGSISNV
jgi:hypothetical protein